MRNIQFEATEDELYALYVLYPAFMLFLRQSLYSFKAFGPVRYARIVIDHVTNRSRGTGFVCFYRDEDAQKVLKEAAKLEIANPAQVRLLLHCVWI